MCMNLLCTCMSEQNILQYCSVTGVFCCRQKLPETFTEAFEGLHDYLVQKINLDSSLLLSTLQARKVITDYQKRHLDDVCPYYC